MTQAPGLRRRGATVFLASYVLALAFSLCGCNRTAESALRAPAPEAADASSRRDVALPPDSPKLNRIRVAEVRTAEFPVEEVSAPGKVEANPNRIAHVIMPVPGRVRQVHVHLGDLVEEGQPLLTIDSPEASAAMAAYRSARSQVRQAEAGLEKAEMDLSRIQDLHQHRAAALKEVQHATNEVTQSRSAVEQAQAAREAALHRLEILGLKPEQPAQELVVRAPIAGKVLEMAVVPGEYRNDTSAGLITLADLRTVWMASEVPESSIRLIQRGEQVEVELSAYPGEIFKGRVMRIADTVDPQTRTVKVQTELDNRGGRLRPEMFGKIRHCHGSRVAPVVPAAAVIQGNGAASVFIERSRGRFEHVAIVTGETRDGLIPVFSGLKPGDRVVVDGAVLLDQR